MVEEVKKCINFEDVKSRCWRFDTGDNKHYIIEFVGFIGGNKGIVMRPDLKSV